MVLVDTSVWVLVGRGLFDLDAAVPEDDLVTCPPVYQESLQGASAEEFGLLRRLLLRLEMLDATVPFARYEYAVDLYGRCRKKGLTIRSSVDCLIAATAIMHDVPVLHNDRDFDHIARVAPLKSVRITRS